MLQDLRFPRFWLVAGWIAVITAMIICLAPPKYVEIPGANDKVEHTLGFVLLTLWFCGIYRRRRYWLVAAGFLLFGVVVEIMQAWMNVGRNGDIHDVYADAVGITAGVLIAWTPLGRWPAWFEVLIPRR